jgi:hypothetical protein
MQIFSPTSGSELVVAPGSSTVLTQRRRDPAGFRGVLGAGMRTWLSW